MYFLGFPFPSWKQSRVCWGYIHWPSAFLLGFSSSERIVSTSYQNVCSVPLNGQPGQNPVPWSDQQTRWKKKKEWECLPPWLVLSTWHELESPGKRDSWKDASIQTGLQAICGALSWLMSEVERPSPLWAIWLLGRPPWSYRKASRLSHEGQASKQQCSMF